MPESRPKLSFDNQGICSACTGADEKEKIIDWKKRENELKTIFDSHRLKNKNQYDCIIPVSGGKDSIYQVHIVKNVYGMNPLCVTFRTDSRTKIGEHNISALRNIGVDHIDFTPNPVGFRKLCKKTFEEVGDCSLGDHLAIWTIPPKIAIAFNIPLVIYGENPDMEYGADKSERNISRVNREWMKNQHILKGKKAEEWCDKNLKVDEINSLIYPSNGELDKLGYTPIFLGYYLPWDAKQNVEVAKKYGFKERERPIMGLYNYADLDCMRIVIHHYFKWLKFGFNRITDNACNEIRKERLTRNEAIKLVKEKDGLKPPKEYIQYFCDYIGITEKHFWEIAEKFRNKDVWKKNKNGEWYIKDWIGGDNRPDHFVYETLTKEDI
jgi:N-acetyl sugar amidotransferase